MRAIPDIHSRRQSVVESGGRGPDHDPIRGYDCQTLADSLVCWATRRALGTAFGILNVPVVRICQPLAAQIRHFSSEAQAAKFLLIQRSQDARQIPRVRSFRHGRRIRHAHRAVHTRATPER